MAPLSRMYDAVSINSYSTHMLRSSAPFNLSVRRVGGNSFTISVPEATTLLPGYEFELYFSLWTNVHPKSRLTIDVDEI